MESIIIHNGINNNAGWKQTDSIGLPLHLIRETTNFDGEFYFFVFKQVSVSHHITPGTLFQGNLVLYDCPAWTACLQNGGQNSQQEGLEAILQFRLKRKKKKEKKKHLLKGLRRSIIPAGVFPKLCCSNHFECWLKVRTPGPRWGMPRVLPF